MTILGQSSWQLGRSGGPNIHRRVALEVRRAPGPADKHRINDQREEPKMASRFTAILMAVSMATVALTAEHTGQAGELDVVQLQVMIVNAVDHSVDLGQKLSGKTEDVHQRLHELVESGTVEEIQRIVTSINDGHPATVQVGDRVPVANRQSRGGRTIATSYSMTDVGTLVVATPRIEGDSVRLELQVERSHLEPLTTDTTDAENAPADPPKTESMTVTSTVTLTSGMTSVVGSMEKHAAGKTRSVFTLVSATIESRSAAGETVSKNSDMQLKIFQLQHLAASDAAQLIDSMLSSARDGSLRLGVEGRLNALIVRGNNQDELLEIEALLARLDQQTPNRQLHETRAEHTDDEFSNSSDEVGQGGH